MQDFVARRHDMVERQILARGIRDPLVLAAMRKVPREAFLPESMGEFAYEDAPLPIDEGQTISQPYIVAYMVEALALKGGETVLEIGTGSGYAAAVLAEIAGDVFTVERIGQLAEKAARALADCGYRNVHVRHADGTQGWHDVAPFDAIVVAAGGPTIPESLKDQLKIGGCLVIPVGKDRHSQELMRVTRLSQKEFRTEDIADVRFVPLIGEEGWAGEEKDRGTRRAPAARKSLATTLAQAAEPFDDIDSADLSALLQRIGDARIVLLGEATHGTSEFYRMRARISQELIRRKGFGLVAIEADWPDAAQIDRHVRQSNVPPGEWTAFARFPQWMWRNAEMRDFVDWLHAHNEPLERRRKIALHGLDLYSLYTSIGEVLQYLDKTDPKTASLARHRYGCLTPWQSDPAAYGHAALTGSYKSCEQDVIRMLTDILNKQNRFMARDGELYFDAVHNARLVANAERYYRIMYYGSRASWNLRDTHMFETLQALLEHHGPASKAIVWAHNSHLGDASATEMAARGETNLGELCRKSFGDAVYSVGFGTHAGKVAASSDWDGPMEIKSIKPSRSDSYERLCHDAGQRRFLLPLRARTDAVTALMKPRLERAIGVIYRPETELASHYFEATLPRQFDEWCWFDETSAVTALQTGELSGLPETYPFGV